MNPILRHIEVVSETLPEVREYPLSIPAVASLGRLEFHPDVTFFVGENGSGKSTLIEAIAIMAGFNPEGGTKNFSSRHRPSESSLSKHLRLARGTRRAKGGFFLRAETMFNISTEAEAYRDYGWEDLHEKSHGEAFLWVALHRFHGAGLYILDEPEAALSPQRQLAFLRRMHQLVEAESQFIISTHSPILMAYPGALIYQLDGTGIRKVCYEETEHYAVTKSFLANPTRMLDALFADARAEDRVADGGEGDRER